MATLITQSYNRAIPIVKSDTVNSDLVDDQQPSAIWVGGAGIVVCVFDNGATANFTCVAGSLLPVKCARVNSTTTTATLMVGLYQV